MNLSLILLPAMPVLPVGAVVVLVHSLQPADIVVTVSHQVDVESVRPSRRTALGREASQREGRHVTLTLYPHWLSTQRMKVKKSNKKNISET